jgi:protein-tyrosine kinase
MSRAEEALRRSRSQGTPSGDSKDSLPAEDVPSESAPEVFESAWTFEVQPAAAQFGHDATPVVPFPDKRPAASGGGFVLLAEPQPRAGESERRANEERFSSAAAERIVTGHGVHPAFVEQYRKLASVLHHSQLERGTKVLMVTSSVANEGKTLTATNLALTLSESYRRSVLLIDADLRRPTLHEVFKVANVVGLGDGLRTQFDQPLSLARVTARLALLTAGRPDSDPIGGLASERMQRVVKEAANAFDWVLVDTPPVGLLPDAKIVAQMVDGALVVIEAERTPYPIVQHAIDSIGRDKIIGVVLNRAATGASGESGYYSYYDSYVRVR